jgi:hypothetical protein
MIQYNVAGGKMNRGLTVLDVQQTFAKVQGRPLTNKVCLLLTSQMFRLTSDFADLSLVWILISLQGKFVLLISSTSLINHVSALVGEMPVCSTGLVR